MNWLRRVLKRWLDRRDRMANPARIKPIDYPDRKFYPKVKRTKNT